MTRKSFYTEFQPERKPYFLVDIEAVIDRSLSQKDSLEGCLLWSHECLYSSKNKELHFERDPSMKPL